MHIGKLTMAALVAALVAAATSSAAIPEVSNVTMSQAGNRLVTITYQLANAPAVVTLDVQTNANTSAAADDPGWTSIGGKAVCNAIGDVWQQVSGKETYTITWQPDKSWTDAEGEGFKIKANGARARITAWPLDNTPDYMVVDISAAGQPNTQKYYPGADFLPGGLLGNPDYRTTKIVMRKIPAKDVAWTMGSTALETDRNSAREATHAVKLTNNYYIGVFEVTQDQWAAIKGSSPARFANAAYRAMRPVEYVSYNAIRHSSDNSDNSAYYYPASPNPASFLGQLRTKTGIDFDLPSEAQWEFAARAGNGSTKWGDGSAVLNTDPDANLHLLGRYSKNGGLVNGTSNPVNTCGAENGTAIVGSYAPNSWGIYDMHGNVWELCLDWHNADNSSWNGAVATTSDNGKRIMRGGGFDCAPGRCRSAFRFPYSQDDTNWCYGFRLACTAGLQ